MRVLLSLAVATFAIAQPAAAQILEPHTRTLNFGTVIGDAAAERPLTVVNRGTQPVRIRNVQLTPPLSVSRMAPVVEPGQSSEIVVRLGAPRTAGRFEGALTVNFEGGGDPLAVDVNAIVAAPIEFLPHSELTAVADRGSTTRASLEIVNNLDRTMNLT